jgi:hypothetical protein
MDKRLYPGRESLLPRLVIPSIGSTRDRLELVLASN